MWAGQIEQFRPYIKKSMPYSMSIILTRPRQTRNLIILYLILLCSALNLLSHPRYVNMVLEDVTEFESTPEGRRINKLDQIFLNGNHVTMLVPGGNGPDMD